MGKYFPMLAGPVIASRALTVSGHAGSGGVRGIAFSLKHTSLQELSYVRQFDAVLTIDAMEYVPPEDWPGVLARLHRAVRPSGLLYLTVEELEQHHIEQAFERHATFPHAG